MTSELAYPWRRSHSALPRDCSSPCPDDAAMIACRSFAADSGLTSSTRLEVVVIFFMAKVARRFFPLCCCALGERPERSHGVLASTSRRPTLPAYSPQPSYRPFSHGPRPRARRTCSQVGKGGDASCIVASPSRLPAVHARGAAGEAFAARGYGSLAPLRMRTRAVELVVRQ